MYKTFREGALLGCTYAFWAQTVIPRDADGAVITGGQKNIASGVNSQVLGGSTKKLSLNLESWNLEFGIKNFKFEICN